MHRLACFLLILACGTTLRGEDAPAASDTPGAERFRGGRVEWARLQSRSPYWNRHANCDVNLLRLMRDRTTLNIADDWAAAPANQLEELSRWPFLYAESITALRGAELENLAEYLRRGGFLLIDPCGHRGIHPNPQGFFETQVAQFHAMFAEIRIADLPPEHEVYSVYFEMKERPPHALTGAKSWLGEHPPFPLRAVYLHDRMIAIISLSAFQCGWSMAFASTPGARDYDQLEYEKHLQAAIRCMGMVTNIYIYAMTR